MLRKEDFDPDHVYELALKIIEVINDQKPAEIYSALVYASTVFVHDLASHVDFKTKAEEFSKSMLECKEKCAPKLKRNNVN